MKFENKSKQARMNKIFILGLPLAVNLAKAQGTEELLVGKTWVLEKLRYENEPLADTDGTCLIGLEITYQSDGLVSKYTPCTGVTEEIPYELSENTITGDEGEWEIIAMDSQNMTQTTQATMVDNTTGENLLVNVTAKFFLSE